MTEIDVEQEIAEHLKAQKPLEAIVASFSDKVMDSSMLFEERRARLRFLWLSGYYKELMSVFNEGVLRRDLNLPYSLMLQTLHFFKKTPKLDALGELLDSAMEEQRDDLCRIKYWDALDPRFGLYRQALFTKLRDQAAHRREQLVDRLAFYENQRMVEEERKLIALLLKIYPNDSEFLQKQKKFAERWARHVIAQASLSQFDVKEIEASLLDLTDDQWPLAKVLLEEALRLTAEDPTRTPDMTLLFWFLELYPQALIVLDKGQQTSNERWFRIELLIKLRRFVDALDELQELENQFATDPESSFAATYLRAQALHGLGQTAQGLELMRSLINVRPEYRSARSFISKWSEGRGSS